MGPCLERESIHLNIWFVSKFIPSKTWRAQEFANPLEEQHRHFWCVPVKWPQLPMPPKPKAIIGSERWVSGYRSQDNTRPSSAETGAAPRPLSAGSPPALPQSQPDGARGYELGWSWARWENWDPVSWLIHTSSHPVILPVPLLAICCSFCSFSGRFCSVPAKIWDSQRTISGCGWIHPGLQLLFSLRIF